MEFAGHAFAADGYHATSVSDIVDGLGVGKGVFYWYFKSKDELLAEILAGSLRSLRLAQRDAIAGEHDPARRIEQGIRASLRWQSEHRQGDQQTVADALPHVSAGITAGLLRGEDPVVLTEAILGVTAHLARVLVLEGGEDPDEVAVAAIAFCRSGYVMSDNGESTRRIA